MSNYKELAETAEKSGFTHYVPLDVSTLEFMQEVRDMCSPNKNGQAQCKNYNTSWSCPPACAPIEEIQKRVKNYKVGILVQTVGEIEDSLDWEGIQETGARHKQNFGKMLVTLKKENLSTLALGAGKCEICETCTFPDKPCRFPDRMETSMEASGLLVSKVCTDNGLEYNYGTNKMAFTSCFLV